MNRLIYFSMDRENSIKEAEWQNLSVCGIKLLRQEPPRHILDKYRQARGRKKRSADIRRILEAEPFTEVYIRPDQWEEVQQLLAGQRAEYVGKREQTELLAEYVIGQVKPWELEEIILDDGGHSGEIGSREWNAQLWQNLNYFTVITQRAEDYEKLGRLIYGESGLMLQYAGDTRQLEGQLANRRYRGSGKSLWMDLTDSACAACRCVPENCYYMDSKGSREKERHLAVKRPDVSYYSFVKFLDTILSSTV